MKVGLARRHLIQRLNELLHSLSRSFFLFVLAVVASPFELLAITPPDGLGLNPVLRDMGMLIHPPVVLAGFAAFAIPFSFACAALLAGRADAAWIRHTRRFALLAWGLQTTGLLLGMWWAYHVLGWGGYWGWDPVENVALMPWLVGTAFIHSIQMQERRGMLKAWNLILIMVAFFLSIFGTFVVRSGILASVHAFALSAIGRSSTGMPRNSAKPRPSSTSARSRSSTGPRVGNGKSSRRISAISRPRACTDLTAVSISTISSGDRR